MAITKEAKTKVISDFKQGKHDTGSAEVQIALLTTRINGLEGHFKKNMRDHHSRYGLINMVNRRKKLLGYVHRTNPDSYQKLLARLGLRK